MKAAILNSALNHRVFQGVLPRGRQLYFTFQVLQTLYFMKEIPESEIQVKFSADAGEKRGEILARNICRFSPFNFQEKWPQKISRKILHIFHEGRNKILSQRDSGSVGAQFIQSVKAPFLTLRVATPSGAPRPRLNSQRTPKKGAKTAGWGGEGRIKFGLIERGVPHRGVPQKCVRGRASGATVRLGHVLTGFIYSTIETRHFDTYPNRF